MRWSTQASNATLTTSPMSQAPRQRRLLLGFDGEDNEVADFVDDRAEALAARPLCGFAEFLGALPGAGPLIEEAPDVYGLSTVPGPGGAPPPPISSSSDAGPTPAATMR